MSLRNDLEFDDVRIESLTTYPSEQGPKSVLVIAMPLMPANAERLGCPYVYKDGVPVEGLDGSSLDYKFRDVELLLPSAADRSLYDAYFPEIIKNFKLKRVADAKYELVCRVHEPTRRADLDLLLTTVNKDLFRIFLKPRQQELGFEGGTRVELGEGAPPEGGDETTAVDRSYENAPKKRGRGRPPKNTSLATIPVSLPKDTSAEWNNFYDSKAETDEPEIPENPEVPEAVLFGAE